MTTPIYYVNDVPHIGHAYTTVIADALARWHRLLGDDVFFLTGTDEHGLKVAAGGRGATASPRRSRPTAPASASGRRGSCSTSSYDDFIRTTEPRHHQAVQAFLQKVYDNGHIDKAPTRASTACRARRTTPRPTWSTATARSTAARSSCSRRRTTSSGSPRSTQPLLDWYEAQPRRRAARRASATRRSGIIRQGLRGHLDQPHVDRLGRAGAVGRPATSSTSGTTRSSTTPPPSATAPTPSASTPGGRRPPPHRQGHPPVPLRVLAGDAAGRGHRAAAPASTSTASCWSAARR